MLDEGHIGGLNGVLLGVAADKGMPGACLLGEMPHVFTQLPFPKASLAVLKVFADMAHIELDFSELIKQAEDVEQRLGEFLAKLERQFADRESSMDVPEEFTPPAEEESMRAVDQDRIESLFQSAQQDRSKAYELKKVLDDLGVFKEFEDRFLDLFKEQK